MGPIAAPSDVQNEHQAEVLDEKAAHGECDKLFTESLQRGANACVTSATGSADERPQAQFQDLDLDAPHVQLDTPQAGTGEVDANQNVDAATPGPPTLEPP